MKLKKVIEDLEIVKMYNFKNYKISSITHNSNDVEKASIFIALRGNNFNGNDYISEAIKRGASCIITDDENIEEAGSCLIVVKDARRAMSIIAKNFYNRCIDSIKVVGVVGTSGKTTTTIMLSQLLANSGKKIGIIGTNGIFIDNIRIDNKFTTPDPIDLHYIFYQMSCLGVDIVIMEISAQAIYYEKVYGITLDIGVFTNISREHLDFFGSIENYAKCKMNYFSKKHMKECVINVDDFYGRELAFKVDIPCVSYGTCEPANSFAIDIRYGFDSTQFVANILDDVFIVNSPFVGQYNVSNLIASITVAKMLGMSKSDIEKAIKNLKPIDGRYNIYNKGGRKIVIDFAHTPASINSLLSHISNTSRYKIVSLFGCVGYSDRDKRIEMAKAVSKYSDRSIVTSDNPGFVSFEDICTDIIEGLGDIKYTCIEDREKAIEYGYKNLKNDEILVLIGKGAENFQTIGGERVQYSDRECVLKLDKEDG